MVKRVQLSILFLLLGLFIFSGSFSQDPEEWNPVYLDAAGHSEVDGVEVQYRVGECKGEKAVYLRFQNHNENQVRISWTPVMILKGGKERRVGEKERSLILEGGSSLKGKCGTQEKTIVFLNNFLKSGDEFMRLGVRGFSVN